MSPRTSGISLTPRRSLCRAACPQAIFISLCANSSNRREGGSTGRIDHRRAAPGYRGGLVGDWNPVFPVPLIGIPLLIVGVILIVAEGGQVTKSRPMIHPGYPAPYGYPPYAPPLRS